MLLTAAGCTASKKNFFSQQQALLNDSALLAAHTGISVYDPEAGKYIYRFQAEKYFVPASNTKIPTCYAAMKYLGDSISAFRYSASGDTIYIQPAADPTFLHPGFISQPGFELLKQYKKIVVEDGGFSDFLGNGWSWNDYRESYMAQKAAFPVYGNVARFRLDQEIEVHPSYFHKASLLPVKAGNGFSVFRPWEENRFSVMAGSARQATIPFRPDLSTVMALLEDTLKVPVVAGKPGRMYDKIVFSTPTDSLLKPLMHRSDNFFAEQVLIMTAVRWGKKLQTSVVTDSIIRTDFSHLPQPPRWADGSGLSRYNLFSPDDMVQILEKMRVEFGMNRIEEIFPTGDEGTLSGYYKTLKGRMFAKTGTLSGVVALSGYIRAGSGKLLIFSVLVNNHNTAAARVRRAVETFLLKVAENN